MVVAATGEPASERFYPAGDLERRVAGVLGGSPNTAAARAVLLSGVFFCPLWCLGWRWVRSQSTGARVRVTLRDWPLSELRM